MGRKKLENENKKEEYEFQLIAEQDIAKAFEVDKSLLQDTVWFEEELLGNNATDFFHTRPVEYAKNSQTFDADDLF